MKEGKKPLVKVVVFVPVSHAEALRKAMAEAGAGHMGNYDFCSFSVKGKGRFRPLEHTKPFIGEKGKIEIVEEERIETICPENRLKDVLEAIKKAHPYEEPAIDIYPLLNHNYF
ncbi:MAG TPA: hypothetical protein EYP29_01960 [Thermoplasmata archaeon]|nr:hypothetical protein [Thermoplasmata archaeon]